LSHRNFRLLWGGQTISQIGSQVTVWALPLTAVLLLHASPTQTGLLMAARVMPYLLAGLFAGAWVDRVLRRPVMIMADVGRAVLLLSIPIAAWFGALSLTQLYAVAFGTGLLAVLFDVAYVAFLPSVIASEELIKSNSRLEASNAIAGIAGPGLAGILVQLLSGPIAILVDALSFVGSFGSLALMRVHETIHRSSAHKSPQWFSEIGQGIQTLASHPLFRPLALSSAIFVFFDAMLIAIYTPYLIRELHIAPALIGVIFAVAGCGGLLGAVIAERITRRAGIGRAMVGGIFVAALAEVVITVAQGPVLMAAALVTLGEAGVQGGDAVASIANLSARQIVVPGALQGRVSATMRVLTAGSTTVGSIVGGWSGDHIGLRPTVIVAGVGTLIAGLWLWFSPVRQVREVTMPTSDDSAFEI